MKSHSRTTGTNFYSHIVVNSNNTNVRQPYSVDTKFANLPNTPFLGGQVTLLVAWPNGQGVTLDVTIPKMQTNESKVVKLDQTEALA